MTMTTKGSFFNTNIKLLKLAGLWVPDQGENFYWKCWYWCFNIVVNGYSLGIFLPSEFVAFGSSRKSLDDIIKNASVAVTHLLGGIKVVVWLRRRKEILSMIKVLEDKSTDYETIGSFKPKRIIEAEKSIKNFTIAVFLLLAVSVSITALFGTVLIFVTDSDKYMEKSVDSGNKTTYRYTQKLPYWAWIPFKYDSSKLSFLAGFFYTIFTPFQQAWVIVAVDTLFTAMISYINTQLKLLCGAFETIRPRCVRRMKLRHHVHFFQDPEILNKAMLKEMNRCVDHLQTIFECCKKMEDIYTYLTLVQVLMSEVIICTCLYLVSSVPITSKAFATEFVYLMAVELQIALYCFFGHKVTITAEEIGLALYKGDWLSSSNSFKKSMLITMTRMRRPIHLTMGKFSPLTLTTFVTIGRGSYSFFAVLKNHHANANP